jgi:hypothetical protein
MGGTPGRRQIRRYAVEKPENIHPADLEDRYYVKYCSSKGYKNVRQKAGIHRSPAQLCSYYCCWMLGSPMTKEEIVKFPRYMRHGFEYGAESHGFKKHGDSNRKKSWDRQSPSS